MLHGQRLEKRNPSLYLDWIGANDFEEKVWKEQFSIIFLALSFVVLVVWLFYVFFCFAEYGEVILLKCVPHVQNDFFPI